MFSLKNRRALAFSPALIAMLAVALPASAAPVSFAINYTFDPSVTAEKRTVVQATTDETFARIGSWFDAVDPVSIKVDFNYINQGADLLGSAGPTGFQTRSGALIPNALDRFLFGAGSTVTEAFDMSVNMNAEASWDFTFGTPAIDTQYNFAETLYHEGFHSLGFLSTFEQNGSYGQGTPSVWDNNVQGFIGGEWQAMSALSQADRATAMVGGNTLRFNSADVVAAFGAPVGLYAPATWKDGSSGASHVDFGQGLVNMEPTGPPGRYSEPTATEKAMLSSIGWRLAAAPVVVPETGTLALAMTGLSLVGAVVVRRRRVG